METWDTLLADIRADLQDNATNPRWKDDVLFVFTKDAVRDYSIWFPRRVDRYEMALVESAVAPSCPLPLDYIEDIQVECPLNLFLERRLDRPGTRYNRSTLYYFIQGGSLYLSGTPLGDSLYLTYLASHPVPASAVDSTFVFTVPDSDIELIRLFVKAKVNGQMRQRQAALDRFKPVGERTDNPLEPEVDNLWGEYYQKIAQRIPGGVISLYRAGRLK
ncbi:MAG: hypothetical protein JW963_14165 [Anaerolineales bacterium]|nr:hypothetical protein [Anaerolineales bacterium]